MNRPKEAFVRSLYNYLIAGVDEPAMTFNTFKEHWLEWGMIVAIYNLAWLAGNKEGSR